MSVYCGRESVIKNGKANLKAAIEFAERNVLDFKPVSVRKGQLNAGSNSLTSNAVYRYSSVWTNGGIFAEGTQNNCPGRQRGFLWAVGRGELHQTQCVDTAPCGHNRSHQSRVPRQLAQRFQIFGLALPGRAEPAQRCAASASIRDGRKETAATWARVAEVFWANVRFGFVRKCNPNHQHHAPRTTHQATIKREPQPLHGRKTGATCTESGR